MRSSRVSLRPITTQWSVCGTPASTSAWRTCQPIVAATESASAGRQRAEVPARGGQQVQHAQLGEHLRVPVGVGADQPGEAAHPVGQAADLGIDQPRGQAVPRLVAGQRRVGEPGAQPVVEPAVELGEPGGHAGDAIVAGLAGFGGGGSAAAAAVGSPAASPGASIGGGVGCGAARLGRRWRVAWRSTSPANGGGSPSATWPRAHSSSSASECLHGRTRLGQVQRKATSTWSTAHS